MIAQLEARLKTHPDDVDGWLLLGRSRYVLKDFSAASIAFREAYRASKGKDLEAVLEYGETLALTDEGALKGRAAELFEEALALDATNPKALWFGGLAAALGGKPDTARERWMALLRQPLPQNIKVIVAGRLGELDRLQGRAPNPDIAALLAATGSPASGGTASADEGGDSMSPRDDAPGRQIRVHVAITDALRAKVPRGAVLFVLARDPDQPGPPFAVKRFEDARVPLDLTLSRADAMLPSRTVDTARRLVIVARYALSGRPVAASGDLTGETPFEPDSTQPTLVTINTTVP
jgi:cytochrome c-type biogenesis protein CcmH